MQRCIALSCGDFFAEKPRNKVLPFAANCAPPCICVHCAVSNDKNVISAAQKQECMSSVRCVAGYKISQTVSGGS